MRRARGTRPNTNSNNQAGCDPTSRTSLGNRAVSRAILLQPWSCAATLSDTERSSRFSERS
jgi:hypothetical protein